MAIHQFKIWLKAQDRLWLFAYIATVLLPWCLIFNRTIAELLVVSIGVLFLFNSLRKENWCWTSDPIVKVGLIAWIWLIFSSILAPDIFKSLGIAAPWIRYIFLYAALKNWVLKDSKSIEFLCKTLVVILFFVIIDTVYQYIFGISLTGHMRADGGRLTGPMGNVKVGIFMAKMLMPTVGIYLFYSITKKKYKAVSAALFLLLATISIIMISGERTAFGSVMIAVFFISFFLAIVEKNFRKVIIAMTLVAIVTSVFLFKTQTWVEERTNKFYEIVTNYSNSQYGQLAKAGLIIGKEHWFKGAGLKEFRKSCPDLLAAGKVAICNLHPHNIYIEWFAELGIIGVSLFTLIVFLFFYKIFKEFIVRKKSERLLCAFTLATLIVNFFPFMPTQSIFSNWPAILLWYSVSIAISTMNVLDKRNELQPN